MQTKKTTAKPTTETQTKDKSQNEMLEQSFKEDSQDRKPASIRGNGKKTTGFNKADQTIQITDKPEGGVTLEQALNEEGEGRTPESVKNEGKNPGGLSKMAKATKIMEELWSDIQSGKVKRKDVIKRFMEEVPLSKAGSSTYYGFYKSKADERRLETIRDALSAVIKPASAGFLLAIHWNLGDIPRWFFKQLFRFSHRSKFPCS